MILKGRVISEGNVTAEAVVLDTAFSWIGDIDASTGALLQKDHPEFGKSLAGKVLVCPTGKGGTIAPLIAYQAKQNGKAPAAVLCDHADPILCESSLVIEIPLLDQLEPSPVKSIKTGQKIRIEGDSVIVEG